MKNTRLKNLLAIAALAFLAGSIEKTHAQNNWTLAGTSPGGGYIIIGNSAPTDLGQLSTSSTPVFMSSNGFNIITVNAGNTATGNYVVDISNNNNVLNNHGTLTGADYPVYIYGQNNVVNNWGNVTSTYDPVWEEGTQNNTFNNWGAITNTAGGDYDVYTDGNFFTLNNFAGGVISGATYYAIYSDGSNFTFNNWGTFTTSGASYAIYSDGNFFTLNNYKGGVLTSPDSDYLVYTDGANAVINNWGVMSAPSSDYTIYSDGNFFTLNNYSGGVISGDDSDYTIELDGANDVINNWGTISCVAGGDYAFLLYGSNNTVNNWGTISSTYDPIYEDGSHNTVNNWGMISSAGDYGVYTDGGFFTLNNKGTIYGATSDTIYSDGGNLTLNNWGMISTNGGSAIYIDSDNNTVNLNGHSSVIGKISVLGTTNVVNLNFTGLSPATIAVLTAQLVPQGVNSGNPTSATFTVRGVNYNIDPAIINFNPSSYQLQAKTPNQAVIGRNLDSLTANPAPGTPFFNLLNAIDASGNVPGALDAISPLKYAVYGDLAIQNTTSIVQSVDRRLNNLRDGSESVDTTGAGGDTVAAVVTGDPSKDGSKESKQVVQPEAQENRWGFFASGDGLFFRGSQGTGLQDAKSNTVGTLAGVDGKVGDHAVIGALFAYNNSAVDLGNDGSHATIESYSGGIYGSYNQDGFYLNSLAAYTRNNYTSSSNVLFPGFATTGNGSTHGNQYSANIDGGYDFNVTNRLSVGPIAGLQYVHLDVNGFNEEGGLLALGDQSMNSLQSRLGAKAEYKIATTATSSFGAETYVAWQHEYLDDSRGIGASFEGSGLAPFVVQTGSPERDAAVVGAALNFTFHNRLTLFADYELQMWNANYFEQSVNGGAKISW